MSSLPLVKEGDSNKYVKYLQYGLHILCYKVKPIDGIFGEGTKKAVMKFQFDHDLDADGKVGDGTWKQLKNEILSIQTQLNKKGYNTGGVDGIAGEKTLDAVVKFQKDNGLGDDGMVGEKTRTALYDLNNDEKKGKRTIYVPASTRLYADCDGNNPGKTLGDLTDENVFLVVNHKPGHAKPYLIAGKYTSQLGWVSI